VADEASEPDLDARWATRVAAAAIIGFTLAWVLVSWLVAQGLYGVPSRVLEVDLLHTYAANVLAGQLPYRDFAFEYPPLALVPIVGPLLISGTPPTADGYRVAFGLFEAATGIVTMIVAMRAAIALELGRRGLAAAALLVAASPILLGPLLLARFDLWPAMFAAAAIWLFVTGRLHLSAAALALGILAKVYPVVFLPLLVFHLWRTRGTDDVVRYGVVVAVVVGLGVLPFVAVGADGVIDAFRRSMLRSLQVESAGASVLFVANAIAGVHLSLDHSFGSFNLVGALPDLVGTLQTVVLLAALATIVALYIRGATTLQRLTLALGAALCAWVALGRVFSPQYLIWLIVPLAVIKGGRWPVHLLAFAAAILLTGLYYPKFYVDYYYLRDPSWIAVVVVRNLVLIGLTVYLIRGLATRTNPARRAVLPST
jgi:Gpi18-like mannosyltransferase